MSLTPKFSVLLRIAVGTFALNVLCQTYHLLREPYRFYDAYSPNPFFIIILLFTQVIFHVKWLTDLWHRESAEDILDRRSSLVLRSVVRPGMGRCRSFDYKPLMSMSIPESEAAQDIELMNRIQQVQKDYLPIYIVGNICLAAWSAAWFRAQYNICQILCTITILAQLYSLFFIFRSRRNRDFSQRDYLTNIIIKPRMAGAILLMFKTWGAVDNQSPPSMVLQIYFGAILVILSLASGPDPTLGTCVVYDLIALIFGNYRNTEWRLTFLWLAAVVAIVTLCDWLATISRRKNMQTKSLFSDMIWGERSNFHLDTNNSVI
ncbi:hypothetical protein L208DRAFT_1436797 [Tricholoma matsutake]|nr:hypothetical protein L208DRAFT_1436797 [Tricholoma matsutake 945]